MLGRRTLCVALVFLTLGWTRAESAERPLPETLRAAAAAVRPAVVGIEVERPGGAAARLRAIPGRPFVIPWQGQGKDERRQFRFEFRWPPNMERPEGIEIPQLPNIHVLGGGPSKGTGLVAKVDGERGLIAAPARLLQGARNIHVRLADGRKLKAKSLGADRQRGIACLEVRAPKLVAPKTADPKTLQAGDWVVAVGGPASGRALTVGVVSATDRKGAGQLAATPVIHSDVFVSDDMAGGPLVNLQGEVVGVTLQSDRSWRRRRQLSAILPIEAVQAAVADIAQHGKVRRGWLGLTFGPVPPEERARLGFDHGVKVQGVMPGQPAEKAGIRPGDLILEFRGEKVRDLNALRTLVAARKPGERVAVKLRRGGQEVFAEVTLGEQPEAAAGGLEIGPNIQIPPMPPLPPGFPEPPQPPGLRQQPAPPALPPAGGQKLLIGVTVQPLTAELAAAFGFAGDKGLVVTSVEADSPAAKARPNPVQPGDLIREIERARVATLAQATEAIAAARRRNATQILLLVRNRDGARYLVVDLPK